MQKESYFSNLIILSWEWNFVFQCGVHVFFKTSSTLKMLKINRLGCNKTDFNDKFQQMHFSIYLLYIYSSYMF